LCFFPEKTPTEFLKRHLKDYLKSGDIVTKNGKVIGKHKGLPLYTIGQRRIGVGGLNEPLEVIEKNIESNQLIVSEVKGKKVNKVFVRDMTWINPAVAAIRKSLHLKCRTRSLSPLKKGKFTPREDGGFFEFSKPQSPLSPGQSLVLYKGDEVVGGGIISLF